jgi:hypothetical protein
MNLIFWRRWFAWVQATLIRLAKSQDFLGLAAFAAEFGQCVEALIVPFESLAACFKGNILSIAGKLLSWGRSNPDPLASFRHQAAALQTKWTAALATPVTPAPSASTPPAGG